MLECVSYLTYATAYLVTIILVSFNAILELDSPWIGSFTSTDFFFQLGSLPLFTDMQKSTKLVSVVDQRTD